jgi:hypothetical protein
MKPIHNVFHIALSLCVEITLSFHMDKYTLNLYGIYGNYKNRKDLCNFYYHFFGLYLRVFKG